jgi:hypothetical protein
LTVGLTIYLRLQVIATVETITAVASAPFAAASIATPLIHASTPIRTPGVRNTRRAIVRARTITNVALNTSREKSGKRCLLERLRVERLFAFGYKGIVDMDDCGCPKVVRVNLHLCQLNILF